MIARLARATRSATASFRRSFMSYSGGLDIAGGSGRWPASAMLAAPMAQTLAARALAARRVGWLAENSPTAAAIVGTFVNAVAGGSGVTARSAHPDPGQREELEDLWGDFAADCDVENVVNLQGMLARIVRSLVVNGEGFGHLVVDQGATLRVHLLAPEQIDASLTRPSLGMTGDSPRIVAGVETDGQGRVLAFHVRDQMDAPWASIDPPVRVPAADILHVFEPKVPGAVRGLSWLSPVATRLIELDGLEDAVLAKAKVSALFCGFVTDVDGTTGLAGDGKFDPASLSMEPGALRFLPPGAGVTFPPMVDQSSIADILRHMLRTTAAGCGTPYELIAGDLSQVNYSSARLGLEAFKRRVAHIQQSMIAGQFLQPLWARVVLLAILSGRIRADGFEARPNDYLRAAFRFPADAPLDPLKAAKGDGILLGAKIKSRAELIAERGRDISDVDREIESDPYQGETIAATDANALIAQPESTTDA